MLKPPRLRHLRGVHDQGVMCHAFTALASCLLGYPDQALLRVDTMIELAEEALHPFSLAFARCAAAVLHQCRQEAEGTQQHAEIAIELSAQEGFPLWHAMGTVLKGWALTRRSRVQEGIGQIRNGLKRWRHTGAVNVTPYFLALLADAYREAGQVQDGLTALDEARQVIQETGERWWEAEAYRLTGEMLLIQSADHADQAEHLFRQAIEVAHELGAKLCELRAAISLSQLLDRKGQTATAIDQLRDVYNWFTDGFDTLELQAARHQLETLQNHLHTVALNIS
ncbi:hypothetical protein C2W62_00595 [Candidatus Entotheonella serta]|nr:hypothetical protein C2W62_00595 [Candidatus Entotheonella serta]